MRNCFKWLAKTAVKMALLAAMLVGVTSAWEKIRDRQRKEREEQ